MLQNASVMMQKTVQLLDNPKDPIHNFSFFDYPFGYINYILSSGSVPDCHRLCRHKY